MERRTTPKPVVVLSQCLEQEACRYNAQIVRDDFVRDITPFVELVPTCPEVEIGLGVPRDPIRLVRIGDSPRLLQPTTGRDLTESMERFAERFLAGLGEVDGFILKNRSPSCGIKDVKVYAAAESSPAVATGPGLFARAVLERHGDIAVEDEGRLRNPRIRHHFLTRLFTLARFRQAMGEGIGNPGGNPGIVERESGPWGPASDSAGEAREQPGKADEQRSAARPTSGNEGESEKQPGKADQQRSAARPTSGSAGEAREQPGKADQQRSAARPMVSRARPTIAPLVEFHASHKLMFMAYSQSAMRELGRVVANAGRLPPASVFAAYRAGLGRLMAQPSRTGAWVNVAEHAFGYFSESLSPRERTFFRTLLDDYRVERQPFQAVLSVLAGWVARFGAEYLAEQTFFEPYPSALLALEHR